MTAPSENTPAENRAEEIRILLIEDNPGDVRLLREMLRDTDDRALRLTNASSIAEGIQSLKDGGVDLVLLDLSLPDGEGLATFERIHSCASELPIIVLSGLENRDLALQAVERGAQDFLVKSRINGEVVSRTVRYALGRKRVEEELRRKDELLRQAQKMEGIGRLAGGVAHDFNNLLTAILGYSHIIAEHFPEGDPLRADVREIIHAAERAAGLTRQLLALGRKQVLRVTPVNLNDVVMEMDQLLRRTLGEDIEVVTVLGEDLQCIKADVGQLEQVVMNLAVNARDAMLQGGKLTLQTRNVELDRAFCRTRVGLVPGPYVELSASDTGEGIPEDIQPMIFEPFFTTKEKSKGTGLGLATVYSLVKHFGGYIELHSQPGKGTEFTLYFPVVSPKGALEPAPTARPEAASKLPEGNETILLVEDEDTLRHLAARHLKALGYDVIQARHGSVALDIATLYKEPIHLILTDVVMPQMDGPEFVSRLQNVRDDFKVLYMSGFTDDRLAEHGLSEKEIQLLPKPYKRRDLALKVREILDAD